MDAHEPKPPQTRFRFPGACGDGRRVRIGGCDGYDATATVEQDGYRFAQFECEGGNGARKIARNDGVGIHATAVQIPKPFDLPFLEAVNRPVNLVDRSTPSRTLPTRKRRSLAVYRAGAPGTLAS